MKIRTLDQVNSRWTDGRHFSAGAGATTEVDDADADAVAHMMHLVKTGQAVLLDDEPEPVKDEAQERPAQQEPKPEPARRAGRPRRAVDGE